MELWDPNIDKKFAGKKWCLAFYKSALKFMRPKGFNKKKKKNLLELITVKSLGSVLIL